MIPDKPLHKSKKAVVLGVALLNLNAIFVATALKPDLPLGVVTQMMTAILFLVGIYTGIQGGIDMVQSNKLDVVKSELDTTNTTITKNYEYRMEYDDKK